ncbi:conjugal transfer protein TraH [Rickettsia amblyommatis]|uniref:conjugal transfer protein TraH n=1 Tax=Rickettsia amblyommatis TaxID=33989 RepID=UPI0006A78C6C
MSANVTKPEAYQSQAAGYYAAGGLSVRTNKTAFNPIATTPPALNMSCSGIGEHFYPIEQIGIKFYYLEQKAWAYRNAKEFVYKFWHVTPHSHNINQFWQFLLNSAWQEMIVVFTIGAVLSILHFQVCP